MGMYIMAIIVGRRRVTMVISWKCMRNVIAFGIFITLVLHLIVYIKIKLAEQQLIPGIKESRVC